MTMYLPFQLELQSDDSAFLLDFVSDENDIGFNLIEGTSVTENEIYTGETEITPKVTPQVLPTANKLVVPDITVKEIPFRLVSNEFGGMTAIIG